jgi:hypothetical protein
MWQVSGRCDLSWDDSVRVGLRYVENWSLGLDAMILWKTQASAPEAAPTEPRAQSRARVADRRSPYRPFGRTRRWDRVGQ